MNIHKNARLTFARRLEMVRDMLHKGFTPCVASAMHGVTEPTARKWLGRYLGEGEAGLRDRSSRPKLSPRKSKPGKALAIVELRRRRLTQARIAASLGVSKSTVGRVLKRAGLSHLSDLEPSEPVVRYEHEHPGDLVHIDTKKLGRIERMGKRIPGSSHNPIKAGWEYLFVAIDDHARIGFTDMYPDEGLSCAKAQAQLHAPLPAPDQRQSGALHPVRATRMGLRHPLQPFLRAHCDARALDASLQLASASPRHQGLGTGRSLNSAGKQPLDASHLGLSISSLHKKRPG